MLALGLGVDITDRASATWTPLSEPSMVAWTQNATGIDVDPDVTAWADQGPNGYTMTAVGNPQPDEGGVLFDANDHMTNDDVADEYQAAIGNAPGLTWGVVVDRTVNSGNTQVLSFAQSNSNTASRVILYFSANELLFDVRDGGSTQGIVRSTTTYGAERLRIVASMSTGGRLELWVNGTLVDTSTASLGAAYAPDTFSYAALNRNGTVVQQFDGGNILDAALFSSALAGASLERLQAYLDGIAGVTPALVTAPPVPETTAGGGLGGWQTALAAVRGGTGSAVVLCAGDSNTNFVDGYHSELRDLFAARVGDGGPGWIAPNAAAVIEPTGVTVTYAGTGGSWSQLDGSGAAHQAGANGLALDALQNTATGAILQIITTVPFTDFDVYLERVSASATVETSLDMSVVSHAVGDDTVVKISRSGFADTVHTLRVTVTAGTVRILGVDLKRNPSSGVVRVLKCGGGGAQTENFVTDVDTDVYRAQVEAVDPDVVVVMLGTNDQPQGIGLDAYEANLTTLVHQVRAGNASRSVVIMAPPDNNISGQSVDIRDYGRRAYAVAQARGCAFVDAYEVVGEFSVADGLGLFRDDRHPDEAGQDLIARALWELLY